VNLSHTFRKGNACADFLATFSSRNDIKMKIWNHPPEGLKTLFQSDALVVSRCFLLFFKLLHLYPTK